MSIWKLPWSTKNATNNRIYADAAAATPLSKNSHDELVRLLSVYGNAGALHSEGVSAKDELEKARAVVASAIGAHADEIIFTGSGTEGNNLAIEGVLRPLLLAHKKVHAITIAIEHQSVLEPLRMLAREGLELTELPVNNDGLVDVEAVKEVITEHTAFVSVQLVNSEVGAIEPVREIAKILREARRSRMGVKKGSAEYTPQRVDEAELSLPLLLHTDASQAPLWVKVGVEQLGVDLMTLDAQKVLGPKGVGALYIRRGTPIEPILWGGSHERGLRAGTPNTPLAGAFAVALKDAQTDIEKRAERVASMRDLCIAEIKKLLPDAVINGSLTHRAPNNINVSIPGLEAQMAVIALNAEGIAASTRSACDIGDTNPSHVIQALGTPKNLAGTAIRFTFLPDISEAEVKCVAKTLQKVAKLYKANYTTAR